MDRKYRHAERVIRRGLAMPERSEAAGMRNYFARKASKISEKIKTGIASSMV
jgi:hypothetical protein